MSECEEMFNIFRELIVTRMNDYLERRAYPGASEEYQNSMTSKILSLNALLHIADHDKNNMIQSCKEKEK